MAETGLLLGGHVTIMGHETLRRFLGEHGFSSRVLPHEESIRVPLVIAGPGIRPRDESAPAPNIDLGPTILELAGARPPPRMHGRSLPPAWRASLKDAGRSFVYEAVEPTLGAWPLVALREERWKYIQTFESDDRCRVAFEELYDLGADGSEIVNRAP